MTGYRDNATGDNLLDRAIDAVLHDPGPGDPPPDRVAGLLAAVERTAGEFLRQRTQTRFRAKIAVAVALVVALVVSIGVLGSLPRSVLVELLVVINIPGTPRAGGRIAAEIPKPAENSNKQVNEEAPDSVTQTNYDEATVKRLLQPYYVREAAACEFYLDDERQERLKLQDRPLLTWTNTNNFTGAVFIWLFRGRPEMIGCIGSRQFSPGVSRVFHEFHSLSLQPLQPVTLSNGQQWTLKKPGLTMAPVDAADPPADSERQRLTQMRNLAREFHGWMTVNDNAWELRLLPQPIFRYQAPDRGVIDGAIFALVWNGTDPEVLLMLEERERDGTPAWHYGLARFNFRELWVNRFEKEIWRVGTETESDVYLTSRMGTIHLDELETAATQAEESDSEQD